MFLRNILGIVSVWFIIFGGKSSVSEWIDMPEFSDDSRIYRAPFNKYERNKMAEGLSNAHKYAFPTSDNYQVRNVKGSTDYPFYKVPTTTLREETGILEPQVVSYVKINESTKILSQFGDDEDNKQANNDDDDDGDDGLVSDDEEIPTEDPRSATDKSADPPEKQTNDKRESSLLDYLPVDFFKQVHKTLSQNKQTTIEGKIEFLRGFKHSLMSEIESRLGDLVAPTALRRVKRGSGWEDDHMGFPSVEGALLAISFLTFAVYLVQLVMMLFRTMAIIPTTTSTIFVNRNKRSAVPEDTARILQYLEEFTRKQKTRH